MTTHTISADTIPVPTVDLENEEVQTFQASGSSSKQDEAPKAKDPFKGKHLGSVSFLKLWKYATRFQIFLVCLATCFSLGAGVLQPLVITIVGKMLKKVGNNSFFFELSPPEIKTYLKENHISLTDEFHVTIMSFVYFGIGMLVSNYCAQALWTYTSEVVSRDIRQLYVKSILRQNIGWHDKSEEGSLTTRLALDTQMVQDGIGEKLGTAFTSLASFITGFVIAFANGWKLALVMFVCMPIMIFIGGWVVTKIKKYTTRSQEVYAHAGAVAEQAFSGIRTVYAFSLQKRFEERYDAQLVHAERSEARRGLIFGIGIGIYFFVQYSIYGLAFWYGAKLVISGELAGATVMVVFFAMLIGSMALISIPTSLQSVGQAQSAAFKIFAIIDRVPEIDSSDEGGIKKDSLNGEIEFRNIDFHYPTRPNVPILKNFSLKILPGQTVAFVGPSGSGKSTSVGLVQRLYEVINGEVLIDGHNIKEYNLHGLRQHIGLVGQEPVLFNMTIKQNILMGTTEAITEKRLIEVCQMANCHNFISMLPDGYDTSVGEHGGMLSGGQKQRIAIARALIKDPRILLLDEATSALDTTSERIVQRALDVASKNRTTITIAHRLSTIRHADLIVVMDKGILVEQGTHESLYAQGGVYYSLVEKQRIAMKEGDEQDAGAHEEEKFNVPNNATLLVAKQPQQVSINVNDNGLLNVPDAREMTILANARREAEKKLVQSKKKQADRSYTLAVLKLMRESWYNIILGAVGAALAGASNPVFAYFLGHQIMKLISPDKSKIAPSAFSGANLYSFLFVIIGIAALLGYMAQNICFDHAGARLTRKLRLLTFKTLLRQEIGFYDEEGHSVGALTARLASNVADVNLMVSRAWGELSQFFVTIAVGVALAFSMAANITGIVLILTPFAVFASYYRSKVLRGFEAETRKAYEEASEVAAEAVKGIRTVVALCRESWFVDRFSASLDQPYRLGIRKAYRDSLGFALNGAISQFTTALTYYAGLRLIEGGHVGFTDVYVTLMVALVTSQALGRSSTFTSSLDKGKIGAIKTWEFLDRETAIDPDAAGIIPEDFSPNFDFRDIAFTYPARPNQPIFTGEFNVTGKPNQTLALVGPSGCGKSTTIGMLERWYDAKAGVVNVGGHNVKDYQLKAGLRRNIALVGQEPILFDMTIRENLMWGTDRDDVHLEDLIEAAQMANVHKFISSLPDGYNTRVGDRGSQLSGGQKQRIAIARALIRNPKILLLDEATSALDSESEKLVQQAIDKASMGRTTITIAHRLSTIQNADQIAVVQNGRVVELGRHFELLDLNGLYAELVRQQDLGVH